MTRTVALEHCISCLARYQGNNSVIPDMCCTQRVVVELCITSTYPCLIFLSRSVIGHGTVSLISPKRW